MEIGRNSSLLKKMTALFAEVEALSRLVNHLDCRLAPEQFVLVDWGQNKLF
ncbi:MAG: hypothetical protein ACI9IA_001431 [Enterobacterales bacterium]|jgi:hypothetical protein